MLSGRSIDDLSFWILDALPCDFFLTQGHKTIIVALESIDIVRNVNTRLSSLAI